MSHKCSLLINVACRKNKFVTVVANTLYTIDLHHRQIYNLYLSASIRYFRVINQSIVANKRLVRKIA